MRDCPPPTSLLPSLRELLSGLLVVLLLSAAAGCGHASRPVPTVELSRETWSRQALLAGELEAVHATSILAPKTSSWQVQIIEMFPEGSSAREGEVVLRFDPSALEDEMQELSLSLDEARDALVAEQASLQGELRDLQLELVRAEADLAKAELEADLDPSILPAADVRRHELARRKAALEVERIGERIRLREAQGKADLEILELEEEKVRNQIELVQRGLDSLAVGAPQDGLIVASTNWREGRKYQVGDTCYPGTEVLEIPDLRSMRVRAVAHAADVVDLAPGQEARIVLDMYPETVLRGVVERVGLAPSRRRSSSEGGWYEVLVSLETTDPERMRPGMSARVHVVLETMEEAVLAPREAVFRDGDETFLYLADGGGWERRPVRVRAAGHRHAVLEARDLAGERAAVRSPR